MYTEEQMLKLAWEAYKLGNPKLGTLPEPTGYFKIWFDKHKPKQVPDLQLSNNEHE